MGDVEIRVTVDEKGPSPILRGNGGRNQGGTGGFRCLTGRFLCAAGTFRVEQAQDTPSFGVKRLTKATVTGPACIAGGVV
jgi:hypothetical protein